MNWLKFGEFVKQLQAWMHSSLSFQFILSLFFFFFLILVEQRKEPKLRGLPTAVVQYNEWKGGGLIAVGYEARNYGVKR